MSNSSDHETAREPPPAPGSVAGGPPPGEVALLFAVTQEAGGIIDRLQHPISTRGPHFTVYEGTFAGRGVVAAIGGVGAQAGARAAESLIVAHRPKWLISVGFAGGLIDALARNDLLIADALADASGAAVEVALPGGILRDAAPLTFATGRLLQVDRVVATPEEKRALHAAHGAAAVDMESLAVGRVAAERGTPFLSVRIISDAVDDLLPSEVGNLLNQNTLAGRLGAVAGALLRRPSSVKDLYRLKENALVSSDRLADFLAALLPRL
jgi:adenosylhomocysteine nucleosidase